MKLTVAEALKMIEEAPAGNGDGSKRHLIGYMANHLSNDDYHQLMTVLHDLGLKPDCPVCDVLSREKDES